jgi:hypothetical protein
MKLSPPQMAQMLQLIGDVVPFGKRNMYPGMGTEGARPYQGGSGRRVTETPLNEWLYQRGVPAHKIGQTLEIQRTQGLSDAAIKHQRLVYEQQKAQAQAALDRKTGVSPDLRDEFMRASRSQPENQD